MIFFQEFQFLIWYHYTEMFKKGEKVIYPKHGVGKIVDIYKEAVNSKLEEYYRIQFFNSHTTVSEGLKKI